MLHALTGDDQYLDSISLFTSPAKKGESTVCDLINSYYNEGHNSGLIEGRNPRHPGPDPRLQGLWL